MEEDNFHGVFILHYAKVEGTSPGYSAILISRQERKENEVPDIHVPIRGTILRPDYFATLSELFKQGDDDVSLLEWKPFVRENEPVITPVPESLLNFDKGKYFEDRSLWQEIVDHFKKCPHCDRLIYKKPVCSLHE